MKTSKIYYILFKLLKILTVVGLFPTVVMASVPNGKPRYQDLVVVLPPSGYNDSGLSQKEISLIIPYDIPPTRDESLVVKKIADNTVNSIMQSPQIKGSAVVAGAESLQKKMQYNVTLFENKEEGIKHDINFQYLAFQNIARFTYKGYVQAKLDWDTLNELVQFEIIEKISANKDVVITQQQSKIETRQFISVRMPWPY